MNLLPERIEELHEFLAARYQQHDRQATEILLAALLPAETTGMRRPWIIVETDYPNRDTKDAWFAFGGEVQPPPRSLSDPRIQRREPCQKIIAMWLEGRDRGEPGIFVESEWRRMQQYIGIGIGGHSALLTLWYRVMMYTCVRLRVEHPRGDYALRVNRDMDRAELARLTRRVLDGDLRRAGAPADRSSVATEYPKSLLFWCELLQKLSPWLCDWETLTSSLAAVARGMAWLYCDGRAPDWAAAERVMRDCVQHQTGWIIERTIEPREGEGKGARGGKGARPWALIRAAGAKVSDESMYQECTRLAREGVLARVRGGKGGPGGWLLADSAVADMIDREKRILI